MHFDTLLIANRGEIACRIIRTARTMGIRTIAVHSDADAHARHVRMADAAVAIGASPARDSYLVGERIIAAALASGAGAIHPGYGFLSENADFAQAVADAGLVWVGAHPASIRAMGRKDAAKALMMQAGVPVTPGYLGEDQTPARLEREAAAIGYPVLIKAVAGGGGKGMRRVDAPSDFLDALASCKREAASSFGDNRVLIEAYILAPRHIEVQVFGDTHGNVVHLFERDCSLQRRHQKVIEEAPAPGMSPETRAAVCDAAVLAARAVNYVGAGTVEFIADASQGLLGNRIWFMEMNTRLQVEHPVTEAITGQDLVEWQIRVARGENLPRRQDQLAIQGWAIEARLYAEDPARDFLPSIGRLDHLRLPDGIRVDTGVDQGDTIPPFYDPMIAKLIAHGTDRAEAIARLASACDQIQCAPVQTNGWFLRRLLDMESYRAGEMTTGSIAQGAEALCRAPVPGDGLLQAAAWRAVGALDLPGFRLNAPRDRRVRLAVNGALHTVVLGARPPAHDSALFFEGGMGFATAPWAVRGGASGVSDGALLAPMPGMVVARDVALGDRVTRGQRIVVIEAMKMEQALLAPFDGVVAMVGPAPGAQVTEGALLARIEPEETQS